VRTANHPYVEEYVAEVFIVGDLQPVFTYANESRQIYGRWKKDWVFGGLSKSS